MRVTKLFDRVKSIVLLSTCFVLMVSLVGCGDSEIDMVKNGTLNYDKSIKIGNLLDKYFMIKESNWTVIEDSRGKRIVEFRGIIDNSLIAKQRFTTMVKNKNHGEVPEEQIRQYSKIIDKFSSLLDDDKFKVELIAQFTVYSDKKSFNLSYIGFGYNGKSATTSDDILNVFLSFLYKNIELDTDFADLNNSLGLALDLEYKLKKFIIMNSNYKECIPLGSAIIEKYAMRQIVPMFKLGPVVLGKINDIKFDDTNRRIYADTDLSILAAMAYEIADTKKNAIFGNDAYNDINAFISNTAVLQKISKRLVLSSSGEKYTSIHFGSDIKDENKADLGFSVEPTGDSFKLSQLESQYANYSGELDVSVLKMMIDKFNSVPENNRGSFFDGDGINKGILRKQ